MKLNQAGIDLIKQFEGLRLNVYLDAAGLPTVGYGHCDKTMVEGDSITQDEADAFLQADLTSTADRATPLITADLNDNEFSALVSFAYNLGVHTLAGSTLLHLVNQSYFSDAAEQFGLWIHAGGKVLPGLVARRQAEKELFLS